MKLFGFDPLIAVLAIPLAAAALLALMPAYRLTARINVFAAWLTLLSALSLLFGRPHAGRYLLVDDLNNVFIVLTTFIGFTTSVFSASYIGHELETGRLTPTQPALLPRDVSGADVCDEPRARRQQYRPDVGRDRACDAHHGADGRHLPHPRGARSGVEVFHPRQRRHRARAVRHDPHLHGGAAGDRRGARRDGVDRAGREGRQLRSRAAQRGLRLPAARLRHQGRPRAVARLAAGCACGRARRRSRRCSRASCSTSRSTRC